MKKIGWLIPVLIGCQVIPAQTAGPRNRELVDALRSPGGLREAVRLSGGSYSVDLLGESFMSYDDLETLSNDSDIVVAGAPISNACELADQGRTIVTVYDVRVSESLKGNVPVGGVLRVALPGGKYQFPEGVAEVQMSSLHRLLNDHRYVLYLQGARGSPSFSPSGLGQGIFEISSGGNVRSFATPGLNRKLYARTNGVEVDSFLATARETARRSKPRVEHPHSQ